MLSPCGILCNECPFYGKECTGCRNVTGKPFWATEHGLTACPIYNCGVNERKHNDCGACSELPCRIFTELKDPNASEQEHLAALELRVKRLKSK